MAIVILGRLGSSTLLNLLVVPLVYARFGYEAAEGGEGDDSLSGVSHGQGASPEKSS